MEEDGHLHKDWGHLLHDTVAVAINDPSRFIAYCLVVCCFGFICIITIRRGNEVWKDLKGDDEKLQLIEVIAIIWLILLILTVITDILGLRASGNWWTTLNSIFVVLVGGKALLLKMSGAKSPPKEVTE